MMYTYATAKKKAAGVTTAKEAKMTDGSNKPRQEDLRLFFRKVWGEGAVAKVHEGHVTPGSCLGLLRGSRGG